MKKKLAVALTLIMLATLALPFTADAAYDQDLERAIGIAKGMFNISDQFNSFSYNINKQNNRTIFELTWSDTKGRLGGITAAIDSSGRIFNYYRSMPYDRQSQKRLPAVSKADAFNKAAAFVRKLKTVAWEQLSYMETDNGRSVISDGAYQFNFVRVEKGIPFPENGVNVVVDKNNGQILSYYCTWSDNLSFPDSAGILSLEQAQKAYREKLGLQLVYKYDFRYNPDQTDKAPYLVYANVYQRRSLDAKTGEAVNTENFGLFDKFSSSAIGGSDGLHSYAGAKNKDLSPKEREAVESAGAFIDEKQAEQTARTALKIDSAYKLLGTYLYKDWQAPQGYIWNLEFSRDTKEAGENSLGVGIDAKTGEVKIFRRTWSDDSKSPVKYSEQQAKSIAEDFIKSLEPEKFAESELTAWGGQEYRPVLKDDQPRQYSFNYVRKANGAYFLNNGFEVTVDTVSGKVMSYSFSWYPEPLAPPAKVIGADRANDLMFKEIGLQLQFVSVYSAATAAKVLPAPGEEIKPEIKLVYTLKPGKPANIDPLSGTLVDNEGVPFTAGNSPNYPDIRGNFAENKIKILVEYGIALPGSQFKPRQAVTQQEFLYLLQQALYPDPNLKVTDTDRIYSMLMDQGIIKQEEKAPAQVMIRQEAVKYAVRALNLNKAAEITKPIYRLPFKDANQIKPSVYGYMALGYGLNLFQGEKQLCSPGGVLTRDQAFVLIYNVLNV